VVALVVGPLQWGWISETRSDSGNAMMTAYLRALGTVPEWVLSLIEETEPTAMHYINHDEVTRLGLDTRPSLPAWLQDNLRGYLLPPTKDGTPRLATGCPAGAMMCWMLLARSHKTRRLWQKCFRRYARGAVQTAAGWF
jgi:hypothetical protein